MIIAPSGSKAFSRPFGTYLSSGTSHPTLKRWAILECPLRDKQAAPCIASDTSQGILRPCPALWLLFCLTPNALYRRQIGLIPKSRLDRLPEPCVFGRTL